MQGKVKQSVTCALALTLTLALTVAPALAETSPDPLGPVTGPTPVHDPAWTVPTHSAIGNAEDSPVQPKMHWHLFEWVQRQMQQPLGWWEWILLEYSIQVACASLGLGAGAAFTPFGGQVTYEVCSLSLAL
jgi:hypothetical protein